MEEEGLRAKPTEAPARFSFWAIANAPITLWLLSSVAIAVISATIAQHQTCTRDFERDSLEFKKLTDEIPGRNKLLYKRLSGTESEADYDHVIEQFDSGELFFVYSEYKGKTINELSLMRTMLAKKLHPIWSGHRLVVCEIALQEQASGTRPAAVQCYPLQDVPKIQVEDGPRGGRYSGNDSAAPFNAGIRFRGYEKDSNAVYFKFLQEEAFKTYLAYNSARGDLEKGDYWDIPPRCTLRHIWTTLWSGVD